jgi:membrane protein required for colicin V production
MELLQHVGWVDAALAGVLLLSVVVGLARGFVFEALSLAGWVAAWFAAQWFAPIVAPHVPVGAPGSALNHGTAFAVTFIVALIAWTLLSRLVRLLIHATPLSIPDRLLGAVFGLVRGVVLLLAIATVVGFTPLVKSAAWQQSRGAAVLHDALRALLPLLPPEVSEHLVRT